MKLKYPCYKNNTIKECDGYDRGCHAAWSTCIYGNQSTESATRRELQQNWKIFSGGHWQKDMPTKAGTYPVAMRDGSPAGNRFVVVINDLACDAENIEGPVDIIDRRTGRLSVTVATSWRGWWWSEPLPKMPEAPK